MEEFQEEINCLTEIECPVILPIKHVYYDPPEIGIIYPFVHNGSLYDCLNKDILSMPIQEKLIFIQ